MLGEILVCGETLTTRYTMHDLNKQARQALASEVKAAGKRLREFKLTGFQVIVHDKRDGSGFPTLKVDFQRIADGWVNSLRVAL